MARLSHRGVTDLLGLEPTGDERGFVCVSGFAGAGEQAIVFAQDETTLAQALQSAAGLILAPSSLAPSMLATDGNARVLGVQNPKYAFALCGQYFDGFRVPTIHPSAVIGEGAVIGIGTAIGAGSVIETGAVIGELCEIGCNVTIHGCVTMGDNCMVQSGAVLGAMGFGYVRSPEGRHVRFPQIGSLRIQDEVEIGAGTTIDRGALGETSIGRGTKIDNLVHIAHNCRVGENVLIAAQVGMAGSCVIEDGAMLGGQVGLGERVTIGKGVILGGQGGLLPGKRLDGEGQVFWGTPARPVREYLRDLVRMRKG